MYLRKPLHVTSHSKQAILVDSYDTTGYVLAIRPATNGDTSTHADAAGHYFFSLTDDAEVNKTHLASNHLLSE